MQRSMLAAGVVCAVFAGSARAQSKVPSVGGYTPAVPGFTMPGQVVGNYSGTVMPVGQRLPAAAPQAGLPVTSNPLMRPYDPAHPYDSLKGTGINPDQILAPLVGPDGRPVEPPDNLDKLSNRLKQILGLMKPNPPRPQFAPGIVRRAHKRYDQQMWRND